MDCSTARLFLTLSRSKAPELEAYVGEALDQHLAECSACDAFARSESQIEHHLSQAMRDVPVPGDLSQRLHLRLRLERRSWYKGLPRRHPRVAAAVAAVLLLGIALAVYAAVRPPRALNLADLAEKWNGQVPASPEEVQRAFEELGFKTIVPTGFNYQYLDSYDLQRLAGSWVPCLYFVRGANHASVYILSGRRFDIRAAALQPREGSGRFTVELRPGPANSNVAYLIKYTGGSLEWLVEEEKRPAT
jgi:hypothetical protein